MTAPCRSQADCLRQAVELLSRPAAGADKTLLLADALDELAREQSLSPIHAPLADGSRALATTLRGAVAARQEP